MMRTSDVLLRAWRKFERGFCQRLRSPGAFACIGLREEAVAAFDAYELACLEVPSTMDVPYIELSRRRFRIALSMAMSDEAERCHVARPGELTYECRMDDPCPPCRARGA